MPPTPPPNRYSRPGKRLATSRNHGLRSTSAPPPADPYRPPAYGAAPNDYGLWPPPRRPRSSRVAYPVLFVLLFFLCVGLAAATQSPALDLWMPAAAVPTMTPPQPTRPWPTVPILLPTVPPAGAPVPIEALLPPPPPFPLSTFTPSPAGRFAADPLVNSADCSRTAIWGTIHTNGIALDGVRVRVWWPDAPPDQIFSAPSGSNAALGPGGYEVVLDAQPRAGWWLVAVVDDQGVLLSNGMVVETTGEGCAEGTGRQVVRINFQRTEGSLGVVGAAVALPPTQPPAAPTIYPTPDGTKRLLRVPILMYHYISEPPPGSDALRRDLSVSPDLFRAHLITLREQGYTSITLSQLLYAMQQGTPLPERPIVLTFDDGYRDHYTHAYPILREEGFVGTFFVFTDPVEERNTAYLTWEQIMEMQAAGMEIGAHTLSHASLPGMQYEKIWEELILSRYILEQRLGREVRTLAYPYGRFDPVVAHLAREAGYWLSVTTKQGVTHTSDTLQTMRRIRVRGGMFPPELMETIRYWMTQASNEP